MDYRAILVFTFSLFFLGCKRDLPTDPAPVSEQDYGTGNGVFITNEGTFQFGNASVSYYRFDQTHFVEDVFENANGTTIGDVCQSMEVINGLGYVVINNSSKIEVVNLADFSRVAIINGLVSPRYIVPVSASKAYVSDLYGDGLAIIDLNSNVVVGEVDMPGWTERMVVSNGLVFVTCYETDKLYVVDPNSDLLLDSIPLAKGGNSIVEDANGKLWILCSGDYVSGSPGGLFRIDPLTNVVEWSASFPSGHYPINLQTDSSRTVLFYVDTDVWSMSVSDATLPISSFISANGRTFYGLGVNNTLDQIYVADAIDYVQRGRVYRYSNSGSAIDDFPVGVVPGNFCFY